MDALTHSPPPPTGQDDFKGFEMEVGAGARGGTSRNGKCPQASTGLGRSQERHTGSHGSLTGKEQGRRTAEASGTMGPEEDAQSPPNLTRTPCKPYVTFVLETLGGGPVNAEVQMEGVVSLSVCMFSVSLSQSLGMAVPGGICHLEFHQQLLWDS